jgi:hypothetical protein
MRPRTLVLLALIAFALTVIVRAPARWLLASFPPTVQCVADGTLWSGRCAPLTLSGVTLSAVHWRLRPLQLLRGRFVAQLHSEDPRAIADLQAAMSRDGSGELSDITAHVDIGAGILPLFPEGWGGDLDASLPQVSLTAGANRIQHWIWAATSSSSSIRAAARIGASAAYCGIWAARCR